MYRIVPEKSLMGLNFPRPWLNLLVFAFLLFFLSFKLWTNDVKFGVFLLFNWVRVGVLWLTNLIYLWWSGFNYFHSIFEIFVMFCRDCTSLQASQAQVVWTNDQKIRSGSNAATTITGAAIPAVTAGTIAAIYHIKGFKIFKIS